MAIRIEAGGFRYRQSPLRKQALALDRISVAVNAIMDIRNRCGTTYTIAATPTG